MPSGCAMEEKVQNFQERNPDFNRNPNYLLKEINDLKTTMNTLKIEGDNMLEQIKEEQNILDGSLAELMSEDN